MTADAMCVHSPGIVTVTKQLPILAQNHVKLI